MSRKTKTTSRTKLIAFKASLEADRDILTWWDGLPEGERSEALRTVIRSHLGSGVRTKPSSSKSEFDSVATQHIAEDTAWIRASLTDLPDYLERLVERVSSARPAIALADESLAPAELEAPRLEEDAVQRRRDKITRNKW